MPTYLFVYGTLKRGGGNHNFLQEARYTADGVLHNYLMLNIGSFPGIVWHPGASVYGEVYTIEDDDVSTLNYCDALEGVRGDRGLYRRELAVVLENLNGVTAPRECWIYVWNGDRRYPAMPNGVWE